MARFLVDRSEWESDSLLSAAQHHDFKTLDMLLRHGANGYDEAFDALQKSWAYVKSECYWSLLDEYELEHERCRSLLNAAKLADQSKDDFTYPRHSR